MRSALQYAGARLERFEASGDVVDLDEAVAASERAVEMSAPGAPHWFAALLVLGQARALRSEATGSVEDLRAGVDAFREFARAAPREEPHMVAHVLPLLSGLSMRLGVTGVGLTAAEANRAIEEAVVAARELNDLAPVVGSADLHVTAADVFTVALQALPPDHPGRGALSALLASALVRWMERTGDLSRVGHAEEAAERAVRLCPAGDPNRLPFLAILGDVRRLRYQRESTLEALDAYLDAEREVLDVYPREHPVSAITLHNIGLLHKDRYGATGDADDLDSAAHHLRSAIARTSDPELRARSESALAEVAGLRGPPEPPHVPEGLTFLAGPGSTPRRPVARAGNDVGELARHSAVLDATLAEYERSGDRALLERVCADGRTLLAGLPAGHPSRSSIARPLGLALMRRAEVGGEQGDVDDAVRLLREARERPVLAPTDLVDDHTNLAAALITRFRRDNAVADLDEAVVLSRRAVETAPSEPRHLATLGTALVHRFRHLRRRADLDEAVEVGEASLAAARGSSAVAHAHANLGNRLLERFRAGHDPDDLDAAVGHLRGSTLLVDDADARVNLAMALAERGVARGARDELLAAVTEFRSVLAAASARSATRTAALGGLAGALVDLGRHAEAIAVLAADPGPRTRDRSLNRMSVLVRLAGLRAEQAAAGADDWSAAADAFADAVEQLHLTIWRGLDAVDRHRLVTEWPDVACDAAAACIAAGEPRRALELLDHGRSLQWGQVLDTRADLTALRAAHPELAHRLVALDVGPGEPGNGGAEHRRRRAEEWYDVVAAVRAEPGFAHFLRSTPWAELAEAAADGPVVVVNASRFRCDALVVTTDGVRVVPLPGLTVDGARDRTRRYLDVVAKVGIGGTSSGPREIALLAYLEWLWDAVAEPVLAAVGVPAGGRLWWCPTGPLALAPLHAAGYHDPDDEPAGRAVLDRVVSSTTPTLRVLRRTRRPVPGGPPRLLVVACDRRPDYVTGLPDLPSAAREAVLLRSRFTGATVLSGAAATRERVTAEVVDHGCVHFACHGDARAAGGASLFLADAPLTMTDIARLDLGDARLAVLSACHTAMGDAEVPDEATHLAAALLVAGFRHVVSSMWAIGDDSAAAVADALYRGLTTPDRGIDASRSAHALHAVLRDLRERDPDRPSTWASFVHFGR